MPLYEYQPKDNELKPQKELTVLVFPAKNGKFILYEDAGDGDEYKNGKFAITDFELEFGKTAQFTINPSMGDLSLIPTERKYNITFRGVHKNISVQLFVNDVEAAVLLGAKGWFLSVLLDKFMQVNYNN